jgi:hypothetical protein
MISKFANLLIVKKSGYGYCDRPPDSVWHALQERDFEHNGRDRSRKEGTLESSQPESFKFPAFVALMKHSDEETRAMAESVLWAYFPDEPSRSEKLRQVFLIQLTHYFLTT